MIPGHQLNQERQGKQVVFRKEAREKILKGMDIACDAVKLTLGPKGRNAFIDNELQPKVTNDGVTIAENIVLEDKLENMGAWLVKNTSAETNEDAGDGTSTTAVLLQAIVHESFKRPENPMDIKRSLLQAGEKVSTMIREMSKPVKDEQIASVATISSESKEIGNLISEILLKVGKDAPVTIEDNKFSEVAYSVVEGLETRVGYAHNVWVNNKAEGTAEYENIPVFATDRRISSLPDLRVVLETLDRNKVSTVVFLVSDMDSAVLGSLVLTKSAGGFTALVIKVRGQELEDMAAACGATLITESSGVKLSDFKDEHLGFVKKIVCNDKKTLIISGESQVKTNAVNFLRTQANNTKNIYEAKHLNKRADALKGGVAIIKVGAPTDSEREYLKDKIEDAVNATKSALEEGLVEGGGMTLYRISNKLKGTSIGEQILRNALKSPLRAIIDNAGKDYTYVIKSLYGKKGYNAGKDKAVDMFKEGIVDPSKVTRCAFENALSTAASFITSDLAITSLNNNKNDTN